MRPSTYSRERSSRMTNGTPASRRMCPSSRPAGPAPTIATPRAHVLPPFTPMGSVPIVAPETRAASRGSSTQWKDYSGRQPSAEEMPRAAIRTPSGNCGSSRRSVWAMIDTAATTLPLASRTGAATENAPGRQLLDGARDAGRADLGQPRPQLALGRDRVRPELLESARKHLVEAPPVGA